MNGTEPETTPKPTNTDIGSDADSPSTAGDTNTAASDLAPLEPADLPAPDAETARFTIPSFARNLAPDSGTPAPAKPAATEAPVSSEVRESSEPPLAPATVAQSAMAEETGQMPRPVLAPNPLDRAMRHLERLRARMRAQVLGRDEVVDLVLVALLSDGHVLLEDFPGSGKTTLAKALGHSIVDGGEDGIADFRRIQFTPDLLPSDVTGVSVFDAPSSRFRFRRGPIFAHVVLADEINRTSPKVQAAMLEAMAEKQVTVDNETYALDDLFFVIATQNPLDLAGTYPLPAAQLDRFLFKIRMVHIDRGSELEVLQTYRTRRDQAREDLPKVTRADLLAARLAIDEKVVISDAVKECLVDVSRAIRADERVLQGNSTRSMVLMLPALQALATLRGRDYVSSDDLETLLPRVLGHRVELAPGITEFDDILRECASAPIEQLQRSTLRRR